MEQQIFEVRNRKPMSWEAQKRLRRQRMMDKLCLAIAAVVMLCAVLGAVFSLALEAKAPGDTLETQQVTSKLATPPEAMLSMLVEVEKRESEQVSEAAPAWDTPLTNEELEALLEACETVGIDPAVALGLIQVESSFRPGALNPSSGCYGYCQLNPQLFPSGLSPVENIRTGIGYLAEQLERYDGDLAAALTAYNAGYDTGRRTYAEKVLKAAEGFRGGE